MTLTIRATLAASSQPYKVRKEGHHPWDDDDIRPSTIDEAAMDRACSFVLDFYWRRDPQLW